MKKKYYTKSQGKLWRKVVDKLLVESVGAWSACVRSFNLPNVSRGGRRENMSYGCLPPTFTPDLPSVSLSLLEDTMGFIIIYYCHQKF